jgi:hypothetical protein
MAWQTMSEMSQSPARRPALHIKRPRVELASLPDMRQHLNITRIKTHGHEVIAIEEAFTPDLTELSEDYPRDTAPTGWPRPSSGG